MFVRCTYIYMHIQNEQLRNYPCTQPRSVIYCTQIKSGKRRTMP